MPMFFNNTLLQNRLPGSQRGNHWGDEQDDDLLGQDSWLGDQLQGFWSSWSTLFDRDSDFHTGRQPGFFEPPSWRQEIDEIRFSGPAGEESEEGLNVTGSVASSGSYRSTDDSQSGYHQFSVEPGTTYRAEVERLEDDLDSALWVFEGLLTEDDFEDDYFSYSDPRLLTYGDDEIPFEDGPFGDPMAEFVAPESGQFTIVVTNFASGPDDGGDGRFDYHLDVTEIESIGVEEPLPDFYAIA